jgi:hypothetical protein
MDDETREEQAAVEQRLTKRIDRMHGEMTAGFAEVNVTLRRIEAALTTTMTVLMRHLDDHHEGRAS